MIYKADFDKPHRCAVCWEIPGEIRTHGGFARFTKIYTCPNGHKFTRLPLPFRIDRNGRGRTIGDELRSLWKRITRSFR